MRDAVQRAANSPDDAPTLLRIALLGGFRVSVDEHVIDDEAWRLTKARSLVKLLALAPGRQLHRDHILDVLWPDLEPSAAGNNLHQALHAARRALATVLDADAAMEVLRLRRQVLSLAAPEGHVLSVDVDAFEAAARAAASTADPALYYAALNAYTGELLPADRYEEWAGARREALRDLLLSLLLRLAALHEERGEATPAVEALRRAVAIDPTREEAHLGLMRLYALTNRRGQALRQYARLTEVLDRELDVEPDDVSRALFEDIQADRLPAVAWLDEHPPPALPSPPPSPPPAPPLATHVSQGSLAFVNRERELDVLQHALDTALAGRSHVTLVSGDSGIGKTSLAEVLAERAEQLGARVVWGRCYEGEGAPAYWPWRQILRAYAETAAPAVLRAAAGADAPMLTRIAPELQTALPESDASQMGPDPDHERFRLFESVTTFLGRGAAHAPLLIVLDDLQWCDRSSLLLVEHLAMQLRDDRIMLLGTYRDEGLDRRQPLARTLGVLARRTALVRLRLEGLSVDHVEQYARLISGQIPPTGLPETIHRQTEGNPFFVREVIQLLLDEDRFTAGAEAPESWFGIPQGVREAIVLRLDRLSDTAYRMLGVAAVIGREFWLDVLADVAGASEAAVLDALDDARAARVLVDSVSAPGGFRFAHALIRQTLYEELSQARRTFTHGRVGAAIERLRASNLEPYLADLAVNFELAIGSIGGEKAIEYSVLAGAQALDRVSYAEAVDHFARALRVLDYTDPAATRRRCAVLLQLGEARKRAGDTAEARATFEAAIELARDLHDDAAFAAAALGIAETGFYSEFWYAGLVELLEEAAALQGDIPTDVRVRVLANLIQALEDRPRSEAHRRALSVQAVELSTRSPSPAIQALARHAHVVSHWSPDNLAERLADTQAVIAGAEAGHDVRLALVGRAWRIYDLLELGDMPGVDAEMEANAAAAQALRQPQYNWTARVRRAMRVTMEGRLAEAEKLAEEAALAGRRSMAGPAAANHFVQLFAIRREQDRLDELREQAQEFADAYPGFPAWQCVLGLQAAELGDIERARGVLREFADAGFETLPRDTYWLANLALLAETAALTRDRRAAEALLPHLAPYAGRVISPGMNAVCLGPADYYLGLLCLCLSRWEEARRYLQDAATLSQRIGMRLLQAYALAAQADVALRQAPVDAERARTLRSAAAELSATLESRRLARHVGGAPAAAHDE